jgi:acetyl-CoA carboxylase biotin carboxylase subunit
MDDGRLTDGQGRTVSFKNTVLIMTSNIPGGRAGVDAHFRPEFINRLDDIVEFAPLTREQIGEIVAKAMRDIKYLGVGTVEFLYEDGQFYFIEMNTRIQVEHPVTEAITDIDLIFEQIRVAAGAELEFKQSDVRFFGHAIECRINAESPVSFRPSPGKILHYHPPGGLGVRIDSAVYQGYTIPPYYDSLVGKLIVHGKTRQECLMRLKRALDEVVVDGIETTLPLFRALVREKDIIDGNYHIHWLEQFLARGGMAPEGATPLAS